MVASAGIGQVAERSIGRLADSGDARPTRRSLPSTIMTTLGTSVKSVFTKANSSLVGP
jgi:hypothetical protein